MLANYGGLLLWFLFSPEVRRDPVKLMPAVDALPALGVGAVLTFAAVIRGHYDMLFGIWMCLFGLVHSAYRHALPWPNYLVGLFYMVSGAVCLAFEVSFLTPWPMGIVFFTGELVGGAILLRNKPDRGKS